jgi:hypothetical protein
MRRQVTRFWWVILFASLCASLYFPFLKSRERALSELSFRLDEMEKMRYIALQEKDDLQLRLQSQDDPAWIELILMKELGVVPEGWMKVHFSR